MNKEHTERHVKAVVSDNPLAIWKMLIDDNGSSYQMMQIEYNFKFAVIHKIIYEELHMKKIVICRWVTHTLT